VRRRNRLIWLAINELASRSEFPEWHARCTTDLSAEVPVRRSRHLMPQSKPRKLGVLFQNSFARKSPWMLTLTRRPERRGELAVGSRAGL